MNDNKMIAEDKENQELSENRLEEVTGGFSIEELIRKMNKKFGINSDVCDAYNSENKESDIDISL